MTPDQTLKLLGSLLTADDNLLIWKGHKDSGPYAGHFFVWSTKLGGGLAQGKPSLDAALLAFKETNAEALKLPSKAYFHSSSDPKSRPLRSPPESHGVINPAPSASKPGSTGDWKLTPDRARVATAIQCPSFVAKENNPPIVSSEPQPADLRATVTALA